MMTTTDSDSWEKWQRDAPNPAEDRDRWRVYDAISQMTDDEIRYNRIYGQTVSSLSRQLELPETTVETLIEQLIEQDYLDDHPGRERFGVGE